MNYQTFHQQFSSYPTFSVGEVRKYFPDFDSRRLVEWQEKAYIQKIRNQWYRFTGQEVTTLGKFWIANQIYSPSYVSFESALSMYGLIPEFSFTITSASSLKTKAFQSPVAHFYFHRLKPSLLFGYRLEPYDNVRFRFAKVEKCVLDYLYLHPKMTDVEDFKAWRINTDVFIDLIDLTVFHQYLSLFDSKAFTKRVMHFLDYVQEETRDK